MIEVELEEVHVAGEYVVDVSLNRLKMPTLN